MSGFDWTSEQKAVFERCGKDLLVTASAGSGKTAVIVERIVRYLKEGSLKRLIVITFTNAAAAELKDKLKRELLGKLRVEPQNAAHYISEIGLISDSYIGTIDAFCAALHRKYFETIDGDPSLVCMGGEAEALLAEAVNETIEAFFASDDPDFEELVKCFSQNRSVGALAEAVGSIIGYLAVQGDPEAFVKSAGEAAFAPLESKASVKFFTLRARKKFARLSSAAEDAQRRLSAAGFNGRLVEICGDIISQLAPAAQVDGIVALRRFAAEPRTIANIPTGTAAQKSDGAFMGFRNELSALKAEVKSTFDWLLAALPEPESERDEESAARLAVKLLEVTVAARSLYAQKKLDEGSADFADIERYALKIVSDPSVAAEIREGTDFIFIDEYQDTNYLQEEIIGKIAKRNVVMVGDPKQSIYRFRHAEPDIITGKSKSYSIYLGEGDACPLNTSFRTSQKILDFVNGVFDIIMTEEFGGVDYRGSSRLSIHESAVTAEVSDIPPVTAVFFPKKVKEEKPLPSGIYSVLTGDRTEPPDRREAQYIASEILRIVGKKLRPCPKKENGGAPRPIAYGDIAVLVRSKKTARDMFEVFDSAGIPYSAAGITEDGESEDIILIDNFLKILDNPYQDIPLAAVMLSFLGGFSETELLGIRKKAPKVKYFHEAVSAAERAGKLGMFFERLNRFRAAAAAEDAASLISLIIRETGFEAYLMAQDLSRIAAVDSYISFLRGKEFSSTLQVYLAYRGSGAKPEISPPSSSSEDSVRFMTVHTSKGLEFPVVFLANADDGVKTVKINKAPFFLNKEDGIAVQTYGGRKKKTDTFTFAAFKFKEIFDARKEEARLLYVALTRARYHLYVIGTEDGRDAPPWELDNPSQWIAFAAARNPDSFKGCFAVPPEEILPTVPLPRYRAGDAPVGNAFYFSYPFVDATTLAGKVSVTSLSERQGGTDGDENQFIPVLGTRDKESGIAYHKIMELLDFSDADFEGVKRQLEAMAKAGVRGADEADARLISRAALNPIFDPLRAGCKTWREKEFMLYLEAKELYGGESDEKILVQGVVDLVIFGEKGAVIVDYKLTDATPDEIKSRYSAQVGLYALALERGAGITPSAKYVFSLPRNMIIEV